MNPRRSIPYLIALNSTALGVTLWSNVTNPNLYQYKLERLVAHDAVNTLLGFGAILGLLTATVAQPIMGLLSDRTRSPLGRRAPYLLTGAVAVVIALIVIAGAPSVAVLFGAILFGQIASNTIQGPWQALAPDRVPDTQKGAAAGVKTIFELLAVIISGILISRFLATDQVGALVGVVGAVSVIMVLLTVFGTRGASAVPPAPGPRATGTVDLARSLRRLRLREQPNFLWWLLNRFLFWAGLVALRTFIIGYLQDVGRYSESAAQDISGKFTVLLGVGVLISTLPAGLLSDRIGRKRIIAVSSLIACLVAILLIFAHQAETLQLVAILAGAGVGVYFSTNWALVTAIVPEGEAALFLGIANMATTLGSIVGQLGGPLVDAIDRATGSVSGYTVLFVLAALFFLLSALAITRIVESAPPALATDSARPPER